MKKILFVLVALTAISLTSCKEEGCPPLFTELTINISYKFDQPDNILTKLDLFTLQTYGNLTTKHALDIDAQTHSFDAATSIHTISAKTMVPFGTYKTWAWGNIDQPNEVYLPNKQSIRMVNNINGNFYMLLPSEDIAFDALQKTIQAELKVLTTRMNCQLTNNSGAKGVSLYISNIYDRVDFNGLYGNSSTMANVLQYEVGEGLSPAVPPVPFFVFPQAGQQRVVVDLTYTTATTPPSLDSRSAEFDIPQGTDEISWDNWVI